MVDVLGPGLWLDFFRDRGAFGIWFRHTLKKDQGVSNKFAKASGAHGIADSGRFMVFNIQEAGARTTISVRTITYLDLDPPTSIQESGEKRGTRGVFGELSSNTKVSSYPA
jgi:hypothetical protein